jgi:hypothetical protein
VIDVPDAELTTVSVPRILAARSRISRRPNQPSFVGSHWFDADRIVGNRQRQVAREIDHDRQSRPTGRAQAFPIIPYPIR